MRKFDFIEDDGFENLPADPAEKLKKLIQIARKNYQEAVKGLPKDKSDEITMAFMSQVKVVVGELGFGLIPVPSLAPVVPAEWVAFETALSGIMTRIRLRENKTAISASVSIGKVTKYRIEQEIETLRDLVENSDLSEKKKRGLAAKLDELIEELNRQRLTFAKLAAVAAAIAGALGGSSVALANAPAAIETIGRIMQWIGEENAAEQEEPLRLASPPKALPAPEGPDPAEETD